MPKKNQSNLNFTHVLEYDDLNDNDADDKNDDDDDDISDNEYNNERHQTINHNIPSLTQIFIVSRLLGKRDFRLSRIGTKKFYDKVRQYQELSQVEKPSDINYGSRMGKYAEILCKLAALCEIIQITLEILK